MKKLNIHRDTPEPSVEDMEKHMSFEEVLDKVTTSPVKPVKGSTGWVIGSLAGIGVVITVMFFTMKSNPTANTYESIAMEGKAVEKITAVDHALNQPEKVAMQEVSSPPTEKESKEELTTETLVTPSPSEKTTYYEPKLVGSIPFSFDESFGLREQWQKYPELSIYENLVFQPIDKTQQSVLKLTWDKVDFNKDENGQYYFILYKGDQGVICPVTPVFEEEDFVNALEIYQEHQ
ncbi:hypothetical protein [Parvicella tangerina]|uniref:Uncharacterized protein n=1 Tax=Parvicella tangerina TaxID=2829795 RepID=A0A916JQV4_9FLAO|nr:hypothetical protein [Parvicella tangerina]CAG5087289.1 hypothetical protein CRYO30217_03443 [Parvicella tangerina]